MVIDAHHHLWKYNDCDYVWMSDAMTGLRRDFLVPELEHVNARVGRGGTVVVQARQTTKETEWLLDLAACHPFIFGVVGWVPLGELSAAPILERFAQHPRLKAVRHVPHDEPDDFYRLLPTLKRNSVLAYGLQS